MTWGADDWAALASAAANAYGAYSASQEAKNNKPKEYPYNYQDPYAPAKPYIDDAFAIINQEYQRGANQQAANIPLPGGGRRGGAAGGATVTRPDGRVVPATPGGGRRGGGKGGGGGKGNGGGNQAPKQGSSEWYAQQAANTVANPTGVKSAADNWTQRQLNGGTADEPFTDNSVLNDLYGRLGGANFDRTQDLLGDFVTDTKAGAGSGQQGGGGSGNSRDPYARGAVWGGGGYTTGSASPANAGGGMIPDTMSQQGWVQDRIRDLWDPSAMDPANDPTMAPLLEALKREMGEDLDAQLQDIGDEFSGVNMYGGSGLALERARTREEGMEAYGGTAAALLKDARDQAWQRRMAGMGTASERDLAAMQDKTARESIAAGERSASASAGAGAASAAAALDAQERMFNREMQLKGILGMQGMDQFGLGALAGIGGELGDNQRFAAGLAPGLEDSRRSDLTTGFGIRNTLDTRYAQERAQAQAAANQRAMMEYNRQREAARAAGADLDDYLRRLQGLAGPYGSSESRTTPRAGGGYGSVGPDGASGAGAYTPYTGGSGTPFDPRDGRANGADLNSEVTGYRGMGPGGLPGYELSPEQAAWMIQQGVGAAGLPGAGILFNQTGIGSALDQRLAEYQRNNPNWQRDATMAEGDRWMNSWDADRRDMWGILNPGGGVGGGGTAYGGGGSRNPYGGSASPWDWGGPNLV